MWSPRFAFRSALIVAALCLGASPSSAQEEDGPEQPPAAAPKPEDAPHAEPPAAPAPDASADAPAPDASADAPPPAASADAPPAEPAPTPTPDTDDATPAESGEGGTEEVAGSDDYDLEDAKAAGYEVGEATSDASEGLGIDGKDYELDVKDFAGMEGLDAADLEALREVTPAELGELDMDRDMTSAAEEQFEEQAEAIEGLSPADLEKLATMYIEILRKKLADVRDKTYDKTAAKIQAKNEERIGNLAGYFAWFSLTGLFLLFLPIFQAKKFPGQMGKLVAMSAMAAGSLVLAILLMSGVMLGMRTAQGALGESSNPQLVIQDAMFDGIDGNLADVAATPGVILVPLQQVATGEKEDIGVAVLENAVQFKEDFEVFKKVADFFKSVQSIFGYVPMVLTGLAILLFFVSIKDLIKDIVKAPERAMRGEIAPTAVFGIVARRVLNEMIATLGTVSVLFVITLMTAFALSFVAYPAMSMFIIQLLTTLQYVFVQPGASKLYVYIALLGVLVFLVLAIISIVASSTLYVGKIQAILRARLNQGVPLSTHKKFFTWRTAALMWCIALPMGVLVAAAKVADHLSEKGTSGATFDWSLALLPAPVGLVVGFLVVFVVGYGLKGLLSIAKYKVVATGADVALEQVAQALPAGR